MEQYSIMVKVDENGIGTIPITEKDGQPIKFRTPDGCSLEEVKQTFQQTIEGPPASFTQLNAKACQNDTVTVESWRGVWIEYAGKNQEKYDCNNNSVMEVFQKELYKPVVVAGSGPSLRKNAYTLKDRGDIRIVSCLHNYGFFEDLGVMTENDYYLTLDSGEITIPEVIEGGNKTEDEYWEISKNRTLLAYVSTNPKLLEKWKGRILFFSTPNPPDIKAEVQKSIDYKKVPVFSVGGNALGACVYAAKAILGAGAIIFVGADFSFGRNQKFHAWDSPYDQKFSGVVPCTNIYGDRVWTWQSYFNFKCHMDGVAIGGAGGNPQLFINATEGGILGAYPEGNMKQIIQMTLRDALHMFTMTKNLKKMLTTADEMPTVLY